MPTEVYFATNRTRPRRKGGRFGSRFNADGPHFYVVGRAEVTWRDADPARRDWDRFRVAYEIEDETAPPAETIAPGAVPEMHRKSGAGEVLGSSRLFASLRRRMAAEQRDALVFIHGFANDFAGSVARAAQLKETYLLDRLGEPYEPTTFVFCWPSDGKVEPPWKYASDRDDAALSGLAMARALRRFVDFLHAGEDARCERRIHLVAHSMGNWALRHAVLGLRALLDGGRLPKIFENAFLMAADEDEDCLEHAGKLGALAELAQSIHVYHSRDDLALKVSDATKGNMDRLGTNGPRSFSGLSARIAAVDCSKCDATEIGHGNHQYYRLRPEVIADVRAVLSGRWRPDEVPGRVVVESGRRYRIAG